VIEFENVSKFYGQHKALQDLSFQLAGNQVVGLLGPNGAGKTTTMKILAGAMAASSGIYRFKDSVLDTLHEHRWKESLGYLPERPPVYEELSVEDNLSFWAGLKNLKGTEKHKEIDRVVERCGLEEVRKRLGGVLSKGYRQRLGIAKAILGNPNFLILDEPISGLDPKQMLEVRELVKELGRDHLVLFSSHQLHEVEQICSKFLFLNHGKMIASGTKEELLPLMGKEKLQIKLFESYESLELKDYSLRQVDPFTWEIAAAKKAEIASEILQQLVSRNIAVKSFHWIESDLESLFIGLLEENSDEH
jgi:ABC-2 type transport system ATP-binding protein